MTTASPFTKLPRGAWDTHVHVFDSSIGPFAANRAYTPAEAPLLDLLEFSHSLTEDHDHSSTNLVIVQPSPYGSDNKVLLEVLHQLHRQGHRNSRGIAVIDVEKTSDQDLQRLHEAGVRGVRLNEGAGGKTSSPQEFIQNLNATADRIKHLPGWKIQLYISGSFWDDIYDSLLVLPVPIIADHIGGMLGSSKLSSPSLDPTQQPGFESLIKLARLSRVYIKMSGIYRMSKSEDTGYDDLGPIIKTFAKEAPDSLIYGSDWPHTGDASSRKGRNLSDIENFRSIDNGFVITRLKALIDDETVWHKMTVTNPSQIYR